MLTVAGIISTSHCSLHSESLKDYHRLTFIVLDHILPWVVWREIILKLSYHFLSYKALKSTCRLFKRILRKIPQPQPRIHLNPWVINHLGIAPFEKQVAVLHSDLIEAAGKHSGLALYFNDSSLEGVSVDGTILLLHRESRGWFTVADSRHLSSCNVSRCEYVVAYCTIM